LTGPLNEGPQPSVPPADAPDVPFIHVDDDKISTPMDRARILQEVMRYVVRVSTYTPTEWPRPRLWIPVTCLLAVVFATYSWSARPEWIWGPHVNPEAAMVEHDADMRFGMYLLAQRIFQYRREFGSVPPSLLALGDALPGVRYEAVDDTGFVLRYERSNPIILHSWDSMDDFLRNSLDIVSAGKSP